MASVSGYMIPKRLDKTKDEEVHESERRNMVSIPIRHDVEVRVVICAERCGDIRRNNGSMVSGTVGRRTEAAAKITTQSRP
jgi:hypothetical protein